MPQHSQKSTLQVPRDASGINFKHEHPVKDITYGRRGKELLARPILTFLAITFGVLLGSHSAAFAQTIDVTAIVLDVANNPATVVGNATFNFPVISQFQPGEYLLSIDLSTVQNPNSFGITAFAPGLQTQTVSYLSPPSPAAVEFQMRPPAGGCGSGGNVALSFGSTTASPWIAPVTIGWFAQLCNTSGVPVKSASIDWGDASTTPISAAALANGGIAVGHTYQNPGTYTATCTVVLNDNGLVVQRNAVPIGTPATVHYAAIQTENLHFVTAVNDGGLGGGNTALYTNATTPGQFGIFTVDWVNQSQGNFALQTTNGDYVTAINCGSMGGPNDSSSPIHTDATKIGAWEKFIITVQPNNKATIQTCDGHYVTAANGGGFGGPNDVPIHTNATSIGNCERFALVPLLPSCP